jgi:uncharacterized protein
LSLKGQLNRFKAHLTLEKSIQRTDSTVPGKEADGDFHAIPFHDKWQQLQASPRFDFDMYVMEREIHYPLSYVHGHYPLSDLQHVIDAWNQKQSRHPLSTGGRRAQDLLFFDTETTGLQGGTGNTIFLLGLSQMTDTCVIVKQFFLPGPEHEVALYRAFIGEINDSTHLVTYNGKSFDWPQVKTRHTLVRAEVPPLPTFTHFDLLHAARRLWKNRLESCRLGIVEPHILGVERADDTPGFMAPYLYFEYLHDKNPDGMEGILRHNEWDVLSLITLYIHISKLVLDPDASICSGEERLEIARWYEAIGELEQAENCYRLVIQQDHLQKAQAMLALAKLYKKQKKWLAAVSLWETFCQQQSFVPSEVYIELSKVYEHHLRDFERALYYADLALDQWNKKRDLLKNHQDKSERKQLIQRIERLEKKIHI